MRSFTESIVEDAALAWLEGLGYSVLYGPDLAVGEPAAERSDPNFRDVVLDGRLLQALVRLNPELPPEALDDAFRKLKRTDAPSLIERNRAVHRMLVDAGVLQRDRCPLEDRAGALGDVTGMQTEQRIEVVELRAARPGGEAGVGVERVQLREAGAAMEGERL